MHLLIYYIGNDRIGQNKYFYQKNIYYIYQKGDQISKKILKMSKFTFENNSKNKQRDDVAIEVTKIDEEVI